MDFIERLFGVAPDGGSGSLEFLLLLIAVVFLYRRVRKVLAGRIRSVEEVALTNAADSQAVGQARLLKINKT